MCVCVCVTCERVPAHGGQKRELDPLKLELQTRWLGVIWWEHWKPNSDALEKQQVVLIKDA